MSVVHERQQKALMLLLQRPEGMCPIELGVMLGTKTVKTAQEAIAPLIVDGRVVALGGLRNRIYAAPQFAQSIRATMEARAIEKRRKFQRDYKERKRRENGVPTRDGVAYSLDRMVQRRVPASEAKPLRKTGPASVFELGSMLGARL